ncbi:hypothetical protein GQ53DRAFT_740596 [Thozetella sp. PMI_491]|nr:hypothetical protein GQ53DRAFT_740596 [Thozetella sp. PMI_491]
MGLGQKLKSALSSDHGHKSRAKADSPPGAFPDDPSIDGFYAPSISTAVDDTPVKTGAGASAYGPKEGGIDRRGIAYADQRADAPVTRGDSPVNRNSTTPTNARTSLVDTEPHSHSHRKLRRAGRDGATQEATGTVSPLEDEDILAPTKRGPGHKHNDSGVDIDGMDRSAAKEGAATKYPYWGDLEPRGSLNRHEAIGESERLSTDEIPIHTRKHNTAPSDSPFNGGTYNGVTGMGSSEDPWLETAGTGVHLAGNRDMTSSHTTRYDPGLATRDVAPSSRNDRTSLGPAEATIGMAGVGRAGAAANLAQKHHEADKRDIYGDQTATGGGFAHQDGAGWNGSSSHGIRDTSVTNGLGMTRASQNPSLGTSSRDGSVKGSSIPAPAPFSGGMGQGHYGPGHEGAKVMHQCRNCGVDNDISHYFKRDAVYRIG